MSAPVPPPQPEPPKIEDLPKQSNELQDAIKSGEVKLKKVDEKDINDDSGARDRALYGIKSFNKNRLSHVTMDEKNILPDAETIRKEKEEMIPE
eukprot:TRINITY_DN2545_c1_g1_i1.p1 TRINITY_DN2545_c1_g1~~TRINITY_DN2545_c1_g1_i1.p1  ORF type:complete len:103 (-),score=26.17 TRINITY_DN2545_c1_g1_i1:366-647(-)